MSWTDRSLGLGACDISRLGARRVTEMREGKFGVAPEVGVSERKEITQCQLP